MQLQPYTNNTKLNYSRRQTEDTKDKDDAKADDLTVEPRDDNAKEESPMDGDEADGNAKDATDPPTSPEQKTAT